MGKILEVINKYQINVISMASSNVSISMMLTASRDTLRIIQRELHKYAEMVMDENMSVIHIIGSLHWERTQVESHIMDTIKDIPRISHFLWRKRSLFHTICTYHR